MIYVCSDFIITADGNRYRHILKKALQEKRQCYSLGPRQ